MNPPDQLNRELLISSFDRNYLVEASAGSGKTTILVERLVRLFAEGYVKTHEVAALTFTRKAAAEMRSRFFLRLETMLRETEDARVKKRLSTALGQVYQTYIGTIHGFCARILREFTVEAKLPARFSEIQPDDEEELQREIWEAWVARLYEANDPLLMELDRVGLGIEDLRESVATFSEYCDISQWPAESVSLPNLAGLREQLAAYHEHMRALAPQLPSESTSKLMTAYRRLPRKGAFLRWHEPAHIMSHLEEYRPLDKGDVKVKSWPGGMKQRNQELDRWNAFCETVALPLNDIWRAYRYPVILKFLRRSAEHFEQERIARGVLNYQDLLMQAVRLIKNNHFVRKQLGQRWKRLLVDEFQDTDPLQAELLLLLTAKRQSSTGWLASPPKPGSLFLVGDPQQSIYRFRRADVVVYDLVKQKIIEGGGEVVHLTANFRSIPPLVQWINDTFTVQFAHDSSPYQFAHTPMQPGRERIFAGPQWLRVLPIPESEAGRSASSVAACEATRIASFIQESVQGGMSFERTDSEQRRGLGARAVPDDFMILTSKRDRLQVFGEELERWGIPHQITGGAALNDFPGLRLLHLLIHSAVYPENEIAVVGLLRSELVGMADDELFGYRQAGGGFSWTVLPDSGLPQAKRIRPVLEALQSLADHLKTLPVVAALERALARFEVAIWSRTQGEGGLGSLAKTLIFLRDLSEKHSTIDALLGGLERLMDRNPRRDGLYVPSQEGMGVRIMNLHKVKGLESRVVILADCLSENRSGKKPPRLHVQRDKNGARGYLHIQQTSGPFQSKSLAYPSDWSMRETEEMHYLDAERQRLLYVAATRARDVLVICRRTDKKGNNDLGNPWKDLLPFFQEADVFAPTGIEPPRAVERAQQGALAQSASSLQEVWKVCLTPTAQIMETVANKLPGNLHGWADLWQSSHGSSSFS